MIHSFRRGFFYPFAGLSLLLKHQALRRSAIIPILINCLVFIILIGALILYLQDGMSYLTQNWMPQLMTSWSFLYYFFYFIFFIIGLGLCFFFTVIMGSLLAAPFNDALSLKTEKLLTKDYIETRFTVSLAFKNAVLVLKNEIQKISFIVIIELSILLLHLLPVIGSGLYIIVNPLITFLLLSFEFVDYSLSRQALSFKKKKKVIFSNFPLFFGFGLGVSCLFLIPGLQLIIVPSSVVGATLLYYKELKVSLII